MRKTRQSRIPCAASEGGFTLLELVLVISITAIVGGLITSFVKRPLEGYRDLELRTRLVDVAESSLQRMSRDVRGALPNSLRVSGDGRGLEVLHVADGSRYRDESGTGHTDATDWLDFAGDTQFNLLGRFPQLAFTYGVALAAGHRIAIYTTSTSIYADAEADAEPSVITPSTTTITISDDTDEDHLTLSSSYDFQFSSPRQRLYIIDTPVSYVCDLTAETITRYSSYSISDPQSTDPNAAPLNGATSALVTNFVSACDFTYDPGTPTRAALLTIDLTVSDGGEQVRLFQQVHVNNTP